MKKKIVTPVCEDCLKRVATSAKNFKYQCAECAQGNIISEPELSVCDHAVIVSIPIKNSDGFTVSRGFCKDCKTFVQFNEPVVPIDEAVFPFGKYKGKRYIAIAREDKKYFEWFLQQKMCRSEMRILIHQAIKYVKSR